MKSKFKFKAKVWLYKGQGAWHFISLNKKLSRELDRKFGMKKRGWGSLRVSAQVGKTEWRTSIFPDSTTKTYLLPLKSEFRKKEGIEIDDMVSIGIEII